MKNASRVTSQQKTLGTFAGVFTPSILTILGIILFLRMGYVVGSAGLGRALVIIALANVISVLTSFSLAAIATNLRVKGGGDYYLISRTLGLEYGGAIGIVLFLAQSVSIAFYCIGFGEALALLLFSEANQLNVQLIAGLAVSVLFLFAWMGADIATRFQFVVMAFLTLALGSFYAGALPGWHTGTAIQNWSLPDTAPPFWLIFAIFFPAVTGFTQGVSMSGELNDPGKSLPQGTFYAVGLSIFVYFSVAILFAGNRPLSTLANDYGTMGDIARWSPLIDMGVIAATLSSAMASFLGAPRILQSLAKDRIFPLLSPFAKGDGPAENPRRSVLLSAGVAFLTIALGQLDLIARLVSMFFLISYGLLNYATYFEAASASPSFRPRFRWYHRNLSLAGCLSCFCIMLAIDLKSGVAALAIIFAVYQYLRRTARPARWADSQRSHHLQQVRRGLMEAGSEADHPRDWRPYILAFSGTEDRRGRLLEFARRLEGGSGITTVIRFVSSKQTRMPHQLKECRNGLAREVQAHRQDVFSRVISGEDPARALKTIIEAFGIGPIRANTILVNWLTGSERDVPGRRASYTGFLLEARRLGCHLVILNSTRESWQAVEELPAHRRRIDIWWRGDAGSSLMLLLAYLICRDEEWREASIRVLAMNYQEDSEANLLQLREVISESRIDAEAMIVPAADWPTIHLLSTDASLTFLPLSIQKSEAVDPFGAPYATAIDSLGVVAMVQAGTAVELDAEPEEGEAGEFAEATDTLEIALTRMRKAQKKAMEAASHAEQLMQEIEPSSGLFDQETLRQLKSALAAHRKAEELERRVMKEEAKVQAAKEAVGRPTQPDNKAEAKSD